MRQVEDNLGRVDVVLYLTQNMEDWVYFYFECWAFCNWAWCTVLLRSLTSQVVVFSEMVHPLQSCLVQVHSYCGASPPGGPGVPSPHLTSPQFTLPPSPDQVFYETKGAPDSLKQLQALHTHDTFFHSLMVASRCQEMSTLHYTTLHYTKPDNTTLHYTI